MKIKFNLDEKFPVKKAIEIPGMIIVLRVVFHENDKYYPQAFLDEYLYKLQIRMWTRKLCHTIKEQKYNLLNKKFLYFTCLFINYHCIIDSCYKNIIFKTKSFYILLVFLLITIALLIAVSIYCYLIKYKGKQKHHFASQITN